MAVPAKGWLSGAREGDSAAAGEPRAAKASHADSSLVYGFGGAGDFAGMAGTVARRAAVCLSAARLRQAAAPRQAVPGALVPRGLAGD